MAELNSDQAHAQSKPPIDKPVFYTTTVLLVVFLASNAAAPETAGELFSKIQSGIVTNASWPFPSVLVCLVVLQERQTPPKDARTSSPEEKSRRDEAAALYVLIPRHFVSTVFFFA